MDIAEAQWHSLASTVLRRSLRLRAGQSVIIWTGTHLRHAAEILAVEARRAGIRPLILHQTEWEFFESQRRASPSNANAVARAELAAAAASDGYILLPPSPEEEQRRDLLPVAYRRAYAQAYQEWNRVLLANSVPSVALLAMSVTKSTARQYGVDFRTCVRESIRGSAVSARELRNNARRLVGPLQHGSRVTITHSNGTHLELGLAGRVPRVDDGVVDERDLKSGMIGATVPGGFLTVALDEEVAEGRIVSNRPTRDGRVMITDARWTFRSGRLDHFEVGGGRARFMGSYRKAGRERNRPAALGIGLNPELHDFPRVEDQELGVVAVEIGRNDDLGGRTRGSYRQFALLRGADLFVDDRQLLRAGRPC